MASPVALGLLNYIINYATARQHPINSTINSAFAINAGASNAGASNAGSSNSEKWT